jgi:DNA-binding NarL/FixJ family response regulator
MPLRAKSVFDGTILVADDHDVFRLGLISLLRRGLGAKRILEAQRFEQVLELLNSTNVALAILDLSMPGLRSADELAQIRTRHPATHLVVLSASQSRKDILDSLSAGVHGYIVKTQPVDELIDKLRYVLSGQIYAPPLLAEPPSPSEMPPSTKALSARQLEVLKCLIAGKSNKEIAQELKIAEGTVKIHLATLFRVLGASNRAHAVALGKQLIG